MGTTPCARSSARVAARLLLGLRLGVRASVQRHGTFCGRRLTQRSGSERPAVTGRAHEKLVAADARPRRERRLLSGRQSPTASEDRVAALAAEGLSNRDIAQRQFVTVKAVQWHLRNVYRKLDIGSREELPVELGLGA